MGQSLPFSITLRITMNTLLVLSAILAASPYLYHPYAAGNPLVYNYAPAFAAPAPVPVPVSTQFAAGDEFGNTQYGYSDINSAKHEVGNAHHGVSGSYQYVDTNGQLQTVSYVADALGFRTVDSRLPVHNAELPVAPVHEAELPVAPVYTGKSPVFDGVAPEPVVDTPEVAAAREEFLKAFEEIAASRSKRETDPMAMKGGYGYNHVRYLAPRYRSIMYNGIYAYNNLMFARHRGYNYNYYY